MPALSALSGGALHAEEQQSRPPAFSSRVLSSVRSFSLSSLPLSRSSMRASSDEVSVVHATGDGTRLLVGSPVRRRALVRFDADKVRGLRAAAQQGGSIYLAMTVASNSNDWSASGDHFVDVHPAGDVHSGAAPGVLHVNGLAGQVFWDVTEDVRNGTSEWVVKVRDENDPRHPSVEYYSTERALELDMIGRGVAPQLQLIAS
jgi:hypothetical protein